MTVRSADFESAASACSAIRAKKEYIKFFEKKTREKKYSFEIGPEILFPDRGILLAEEGFCKPVQGFSLKEDA